MYAVGEPKDNNTNSNKVLDYSPQSFKEEEKKESQDNVEVRLHTFGSDQDS